jgi:hypothetical protein
MGIFNDLRKVKESKFYSGRVWTTADGTKIPVEDMTDSHLENAIRHVERQAKRFINRWGADFYYAEIATGWWPQGEMAQYYLESELSMMRAADFDFEDSLTYADVLDDNADYSMLVREKKRRENERKRKAKNRSKQSR